MYDRTQQIMPKGGACRWCHSNIRGKEFDRLFNIAENQRYPYGDERVADEFKIMCENLLAYMEELAT